MTTGTATGATGVMTTVAIISRAMSNAVVIMSTGRRSIAGRNGAITAKCAAAADDALPPAWRLGAALYAFPDGKEPYEKA